MKKFGNFEGKILSKNEMRSINGGAEINCTITASDGTVMSSGGCASSVMSECVSYTSRNASSLSMQAGESMDWECH